MGEILGIYARQSVDKKDSISIESQIEFCKREYPNMPMKIYIDKGYSGKNTNRPQFNEMMSDIEGGLISKVIVYKLDRISRSLLDFSNIIEKFKQYSVEFNSSQEKFDTSTPMGNAMLSITMVFAQLERETIQQRITDNYYERGKLGVHLGGVAPYGFEIINQSLNGKKVSCLSTNQTEIEALRFMFHSYADDLISLGEIARQLNDKKIPTRKNSTWSSSRVSLTLRNPACVKADVDVYNYYSTKECLITNPIDDFVGENGCIFYGKRDANTRKYTEFKEQKITLGLHKGEISSDLFLRSQYRLDNNHQIKRDGQGSHSWLSGIIKCGKCGYSFTAIKTPKKNKDYYFFRCGGRLQNACTGHSIAFDVRKIENYVQDQLFEIIDANSDLSFSETFQENADNDLKMKISKIENQINNLLLQIENGNNVVQGYLNDRITSLDTERRALSSKLLENVVTKQPKTGIKKLTDVRDSWDTISLDEKKQLVQLFIEKVVLTDKKIQIFWKCQFKEYLGEKNTA